MGRHTIGAGWFRRLGSSRDGDGEGVRKSQRRSPKWRRRLLSVFSPSAWRWRRPDFRFNVLDRVVFHLLYVVEAIVLVAVFCFYFCRFGCRI